MVEKHFIWKDETDFVVAAISVNSSGQIAYFGVNRMVENVDPFIKALINQPNGPNRIQRNNQNCLQWTYEWPWDVEVNYTALTQPFVELLGTVPVEIDHTAYQQFPYATNVLTAHSDKVVQGVQGQVLGRSGMETLPNGQKIPTIQVRITGTDGYIYLRTDEFTVVE